jgi:hypothetical protein
MTGHAPGQFEIVMDDHGRYYRKEWGLSASIADFS